MTSAPRRPISGWDGFYEITITGSVWSCRAGRYLAYAKDEHGRPYIEVQIGAVRYERNLKQTVEEAWGDTSQLTTEQCNPAPRLDPAAIGLWDKIYGTYSPPKRWGTARRWAIHDELVGRRGLFQCTGIINKDDRQGSLGSQAMKPIGPDADHFPGMGRIPLGHLVNLERAPREAGQWAPAKPSTVRVTRKGAVSSDPASPAPS